MQYLERYHQPLPFHVWTYYLVVSIATVGYGDITPISEAGRGLAMFIILFAIISLPAQTNELIEKMNRYSVYARVHYDVRGHNKHVLICGDLKSTSLNEFFSELFHEDHENMNLNCVILQPGMYVCMYVCMNVCVVIAFCTLLIVCMMDCVHLIGWCVINH
jgi:hypothetical protein